MNIFNYIIQLGASVMMPVIFTIIGLCIGMKFGKALKSGLYVGVGFVGLGIVTALLTDNFKDPLQAIEDIFSLNLSVFDMGWPAAASVAYNTAVGALIIPICLGINFLMIVTKTTRTVNIDLWNYWHFAFIGAVVYFVFDESLLWGYFAAIVCYILTLIMADLTAFRFQKYYDLPGISVPQPFCQSLTPFAIGLGWLLDRIPGFDKLNIDADGLKKKFGVIGEPLVLGVIVGCAIAEAFAEAGAKIAFNCRSKEHLDKALADYQTKGIEAKGYIADVTDEEQVKNLVADIERDLGTIDILVNNAGIIKRIPMLDMSVEDFRKVW